MRLSSFSFDKFDQTLIFEFLGKRHGEEINVVSCKNELEALMQIITILKISPEEILMRMEEMEY